MVEKRRVRRDRADIFCTLAEGIKGQRAVDWRLVDAIAPKSRFESLLNERLALAAPTASRTLVLVSGAFTALCATDVVGRGVRGFT